MVNFREYDLSSGGEEPAKSSRLRYKQSRARQNVTCLCQSTESSDDLRSPTSRHHQSRRKRRFRTGNNPDREVKDSIRSKSKPAEKLDNKCAKARGKSEDTKPDEYNVRNRRNGVLRKEKRGSRFETECNAGHERTKTSPQRTVEATRGRPKERGNRMSNPTGNGDSGVPLKVAEGNYKIGMSHVEKVLKEVDKEIAEKSHKRSIFQYNSIARNNESNPPINERGSNRNETPMPLIIDSPLITKEDDMREYAEELAKHAMQDRRIRKPVNKGPFSSNSPQGDQNLKRYRTKINEELKMSRKSPVAESKKSNGETDSNEVTKGKLYLYEGRRRRKAMFIVGNRVTSLCLMRAEVELDTERDSRPRRQKVSKTMNQKTRERVPENASPEVKILFQRSENKSKVKSEQLKDKKFKTVTSNMNRDKRRRGHKDEINKYDTLNANRNVGLEGRSNLLKTSKLTEKRSKSMPAKNEEFRNQNQNGPERIPYGTRNNGESSLLDSKRWTNIHKKFDNGKVLISKYFQALNRPLNTARFESYEYEKPKRSRSLSRSEIVANIMRSRHKRLAENQRRTRSPDMRSKEEEQRASRRRSNPDKTTVVVSRHIKDFIATYSNDVTVLKKPPVLWHQNGSDSDRIGTAIRLAKQTSKSTTVIPPAKEKPQLVDKKVGSDTPMSTSRPVKPEPISHHTSRLRPRKTKLLRRIRDITVKDRIKIDYYRRALSPNLSTIDEGVEQQPSDEQVATMIARLGKLFGVYANGPDGLKEIRLKLDIFLEALKNADGKGVSQTDSDRRLEMIETIYKDCFVIRPDEAASAPKSSMELFFENVMGSKRGSRSFSRNTNRQVKNPPLTKFRVNPVLRKQPVKPMNRLPSAKEPNSPGRRYNRQDMPSQLINVRDKLIEIIEWLRGSKRKRTKSSAESLLQHVESRKNAFGGATRLKLTPNPLSWYSFDLVGKTKPDPTPMCDLKPEVGKEKWQAHLGRGEYMSAVTEEVPEVVSISVGTSPEPLHTPGQKQISGITCVDYRWPKLDIETPSEIYQEIMCDRCKIRQGKEEKAMKVIKEEDESYENASHFLEYAFGSGKMIDRVGVESRIMAGTNYKACYQSVTNGLEMETRPEIKAAANSSDVVTGLEKCVSKEEADLACNIEISTTKISKEESEEIVGSGPTLNTQSLEPFQENTRPVYKSQNVREQNNISRKSPIRKDTTEKRTELDSTRVVTRNLTKKQSEEVNLKAANKRLRKRYTIQRKHAQMRPRAARPLARQVKDSPKSSDEREDTSCSPVSTRHGTLLKSEALSSESEKSHSHSPRCATNGDINTTTENLHQRISENVVQEVEELELPSIRQIQRMSFQQYEQDKLIRRSFLEKRSKQKVEQWCKDELEPNLGDMSELEDNFQEEMEKERDERMSEIMRNPRQKTPHEENWVDFDNEVKVKCKTDFPAKQQSRMRNDECKQPTLKPIRESLVKSKTNDDVRVDVSERSRAQPMANVLPKRDLSTNVEHKEMKPGQLLSAEWKNAAAHKDREVHPHDDAISSMQTKNLTACSPKAMNRRSAQNSSKKDDITKTCGVPKLTSTSRSLKGEEDSQQAPKRTPEESNQRITTNPKPRIPQRMPERITVIIPQRKKSMRSIGKNPSGSSSKGSSPVSTVACVGGSKRNTTFRRFERPSRTFPTRVDNRSRVPARPIARRGSSKLIKPTASNRSTQRSKVPGNHEENAIVDTKKLSKIVKGLEEVLGVNDRKVNNRPVPDFIQRNITWIKTISPPNPDLARKSYESRMKTWQVRQKMLRNGSLHSGSGSGSARTPSRALNRRLDSETRKPPWWPYGNWRSMESMRMTRVNKEEVKKKLPTRRRVVQENVMAEKVGEDSELRSIDMDNVPVTEGAAQDPEVNVVPVPNVTPVVPCLPKKSALKKSPATPPARILNISKKTTLPNVEKTVVEHNPVIQCDVSSEVTGRPRHEENPPVEVQPLVTSEQGNKSAAGVTCRVKIVARDADKGRKNWTWKGGLGSKNGCSGNGKSSAVEEKKAIGKEEKLRRRERQKAAEELRIAGLRKTEVKRPKDKSTKPLISNARRNVDVCKDVATPRSADVTRLDEKVNKLRNSTEGEKRLAGCVKDVDKSDGAGETQYKYPARQTLGQKTKPKYKRGQRSLSTASSQRKTGPLKRIWNGVGKIVKPQKQNIVRIPIQIEPDSLEAKSEVLEVELSDENDFLRSLMKGDLTNFRVDIKSSVDSAMAGEIDEDIETIFRTFDLTPTSRAKLDCAALNGISQSNTLVKHKIIAFYHQLMQDIGDENNALGYEVIDPPVEIVFPYGDYDHTSTTSWSTDGRAEWMDSMKLDLGSSLTSSELNLTDKEGVNCLTPGLTESRKLILKDINAEVLTRFADKCASGEGGIDCSTSVVENNENEAQEGRSDFDGHTGLSTDEFDQQDCKTEPNLVDTLKSKSLRKDTRGEKVYAHTFRRENEDVVKRVKNECGTLKSPKFRRNDCRTNRGIDVGETRLQREEVKKINKENGIVQKKIAEEEKRKVRRTTPGLLKRLFTRVKNDTINFSFNNEEE